MNDVVFILIGSGATADAEYVKDKGSVLCIDSSVAVMELAEPGVATFQLMPSPSKVPPPEVPTKFININGSGSALVSANGYFAAVDNFGLKSAVQRAVANATVIYVRISEKGGTGNGAAPIIQAILRQTQPEGKVIFIHQFDPAVNPFKEFQRLQDLREGTSIGEHIITRYPETVKKIYRLEAHHWDAILEVNLNVKALQGGGNLTVMNVVTIDHNEFVNEIAGSIMSSLRDRWVRGQMTMSHDDLMEARSSISQLFEKLHRDASAKIYLNGQARQVIRSKDREKIMKVINVELEDARLDGRQYSSETLRELNQIVTKVGYENVRDIFEQRREHLNAEISEIEEELDGNGWDKLFASPSWWRSVFLSIWPDGVENAAERLFKKEVVRSRMLDLLATLDTHFINRYTTGSERQLKYWLPEGELKHEFQNILLEASDEEAGLSLLKNELKLRLDDVLLASLPYSIRQRIAFDFRVDSSVEEAKGAVIESDLPKLMDLFERLNFNPAQCKFVTGEKGKTTIISFAIPNSLLDIYEIAALIRREDNNYKADKSKKFYARRVHDMFRPQFRYDGTVGREEAALALVKAFLTPGVLRIFRKNKHEISLTLAGRTTSYIGFDDFVKKLSENDELSVHENFWDAFCAERASMVKDVSNLSSENLIGEQHERYIAIKALVGAELWNHAVELMLEQVRFANESYK